MRRSAMPVLATLVMALCAGAPAVAASGDFVPGRCVKGDCRDGEGRMRWDDGTRFVGRFRESQPVHGWVRLPDGSRYEGGLRDGLFHGPGRLRTPDGALHEGIFKDGVLQVAEGGSR